MFSIVSYLANIRCYLSQLPSYHESVGGHRRELILIDTLLRGLMTSKRNLSDVAKIFSADTGAEITVH